MSRQFKAMFISLLFGCCSFNLIESILRQKMSQFVFKETALELSESFFIHVNIKWTRFWYKVKLFLRLCRR